MFERQFSALSRFQDKVYKIRFIFCLISILWCLPFFTPLYGVLVL